MPSTGSICDALTGESWSAPEIRAATARRLDDLSRGKVGPGDPVIIAYGGRPSFFADLFAVWHAGAVAVCINPALTDHEFANVVSFVQPRLVISEQDRGSCDVPRLPPVEKTGGDDPCKSLRDIDAPDSAPALVLFTSGTTGTPKGVVLSYGALAARVALNLENIPADNLRRTLCLLPTHFGHGLIGNCLTALATGGDVFLMGDGGVQNAAHLADVVERHGITFMSSTPSFWRIALRSRRPLTPTPLCMISVGSAPVPAAMVQAVSKWAGTEDVRVMYGITEGANWLAGYSMEDHTPEDGYVGRMWGGEVAVCVGNGEVVRHGEGEILINSPSLMTGYLERPELTQEVMGEGWYHTGDRGRVSSDGDIFLTGRIKEEINRGGTKISPMEIDMLMEKHPDVAEACTFPVPDVIAGELVGIAIRLNEGAETDMSELRTWCATMIRRECVPDHWTQIPELPTTDRGKVDRRLVRARCLEDGTHG